MTQTTETRPDCGFLVPVAPTTFDLIQVKFVGRSTAGGLKRPQSLLPSPRARDLRWPATFCVCQEILTTRSRPLVLRATHGTFHTYSFSPDFFDRVEILKSGLSGDAANEKRLDFNTEILSTSIVPRFWNLVAVSDAAFTPQQGREPSRIPPDAHGGD